MHLLQHSECLRLYVDPLADIGPGLMSRCERQLCDAKPSVERAEPSLLLAAKRAALALVVLCSFGRSSDRTPCQDSASMFASFCICVLAAASAAWSKAFWLAGHCRFSSSTSAAYSDEVSNIRLGKISVSNVALSSGPEQSQRFLTHSSRIAFQNVARRLRHSVALFNHVLSWRPFWPR